MNRVLIWRVRDKYLVELEENARTTFVGLEAESLLLEAGAPGLVHCYVAHFTFGWTLEGVAGLQVARVRVIVLVVHYKLICYILTVYY